MQSKKKRLKLIVELGQIIYPVPIRIDGLMSVITNQQEIDVIMLDQSFTVYDCDYNNKLCTYKERKNVSMKDYILERYGQRAVDILTLLTIGVNV